MFLHLLASHHLPPWAEAGSRRFVFFVCGSFSSRRRFRAWATITVSVEAATPISPVATTTAAITTTVTAAAKSAAATALPVILTARHAGIERLIQIDRGEIYSSLPIHLNNAHLDLIAQLHRLFRTPNGRIRKMADMYQALFAGQYLNKGAHADKPCFLAGVEGANLDVPHHSKNDVGRPAARFLVHRGDVDLAILLDVDLSAGICGNLLNHLAARADD